MLPSLQKFHPWDKLPQAFHNAQYSPYSFFYYTSLIYQTLARLQNRNFFADDTSSYTMDKNKRWYWKRREMAEAKQTHTKYWEMWINMHRKNKTYFKKYLPKRKIKHTCLLVSWCLHRQKSQFQKPHSLCKKKNWPSLVDWYKKGYVCILGSVH